LAEEVDHKIRIVERPDLRLVWENLQSLCGRCHAAKSAAERSGRPMIGCDVDGVPLDPGHPWNQTE
jgi:5-methylcytosine-specific restriction endonuclease McrA